MNCTLVLFGDVAYGVPVKNFPTLPVGSGVELHLGNFVFDDLTIRSYRASNKYGTIVNISIDCDNPPPGAPNREQLREMFVESDNALCEYIYPHTIDFA